MTLTNRQAWVYLAAAIAFYGGIVGLALTYGQAQMNLQRSAALLLLIPMSGAAAITCVAYLVAERSPTSSDGPSFAVASSPSALWLMWGLALPTTLRQIRRGR